MDELDELENFRTPTEFLQEIEALVKDKKMEYIDAVIHYCNEQGIELETAASLIKSSMVMKAKIQDEAENLGYLQRSAKLPL